MWRKPGCKANSKLIERNNIYEGIEKSYKVEAYVNDFVIEKRCKELGLKGVPAVCARDGIMPTEDMILQK